ncbi:MAG: RagB/SusD family nutrient uptake outer membrane protein [Gemmatimonadetes bacterium 13_1_20CM_4_66_11]|nr:MAG: RagB/SusD family nutrient uptake outer membrane protein [Gemmatimonadetes bacterium 13_2_20CM_2_66_5]OLC88143.1 MAG: RagB/SusD family nutrient uptake outer membrane protein [Gemmatimonadetes bacterium 13_1_40CM_3_66_12]OLD88533.1 MAG: RagB/SusD family nutrient uptake outer membrane protein [Gemmatimonadetes bacterium 13_1_20CM_4_66_11]
MNRLTVTYTGALLMLALGCKDLTLGPKDQVSDASFWKTPDQFRLAANDFYYGLQGADNWTEISSDIATGSGSTQMSSVSNGSYLPAANSDLWDKSYAGIRATNYLLTKAAESGLGTQIDRWVGEALFFRAYHYWNLVKTYGGVPLITKVLDVTSPEVYTARSTQQQIIDFILADLDNAVPKLLKQSQLGADEMGRVTQGAALALKARAALYQATWLKYHAEGSPTAMLTAAITAADQLVASGEYQLYAGQGAQSYKYLFILQGDDSPEVILARRYYAGRATHNWTRELWFNYMIPTKKLADMYLATDGLPITSSPLFKGYDSLKSEFQNRDPRMAMTFVVPGSDVFQESGFQPVFPGFSGSNATRTGYMLRKFLDETVEATQFAGEYDFKEFRYGEVLLILAEALFERDGVISDADLNRTINLLRARAGMPSLTNGFVSANGLDMLTEIRRERTVELAFEGYRRDDLRRWKTAETEMPQALRGVKFVGTEYQTRYPGLQIGSDIQVDANGFIVAEAAASRQFVVPKHYLDPIPLQQIQLSHGTLTQNPGW